jgi:DHA3 family tetracycline resistance protein-like MFS transporter
MLRSLRATPLYIAMRAANAFAFALVLTYELVYQTAIVGLNPFQLVLVGVVLESMTFFFEIPTGMLADVYSRRFAVILGILLTGAGFLAEGLVPTFAFVLIGQVLWGIGFTFYSGAETAWLADEIGMEHVHAVLLRATQIAQVCTIAGTFAGAALSRIAPVVPVLAGAALYLLLGLGLSLVMPEHGFQRIRRDEDHNLWQHLAQPFRETTRLVRVHPILWMILLLGMIIGLSIGGFDRLYTPHLLQDFVFPSSLGLEAAAWPGIINGVVAVTSLLGMEVVRRRARTTDQAVIIRLLTGMYCGMLVGSALFAAAHAFSWAIGGFVLSQTLRNVSRPLLIVWINQNAAPRVRATVISTYWQSNALGQIVGSPALGWLGTVGTLRLALEVGTAVYVATLPLLLFAQRRWTRMQHAAEINDGR